jgi:hypothetical protein
MFFMYVETLWQRYKTILTEQKHCRAQQQQHQAATNNNYHHKHAATMPKNATTKQGSNGGSKAGPYQVQGGSKGSGTNRSQEKGDKPAGTSNVSWSRSVVGQNDSQPNGSSRRSKQQQGYTSARSGDEYFATGKNSSTMSVGKSATSNSSTNASLTPVAGPPSTTFRQFGNRFLPQQS